MAFWTDPAYEPLKSFQFRLFIGDKSQSNAPEIFAKQITLPSFEINQAEYTLVNQKFKYPGMLTWNDVNVTLIETGKTALKIMGMLNNAGYACPGDCGQGLSKDKFGQAGVFMIEQLTRNGTVLQSWELQNWFIKGARFGEMNYESDEFVNVEITVGYDCAVRGDASTFGRQGLGEGSMESDQSKYRKQLEEAEENIAEKISREVQEKKAKRIKEAEIRRANRQALQQMDLAVNTVGDIITADLDK